MSLQSKLAWRPVEPMDGRGTAQLLTSAMSNNWATNQAVDKAIDNAIKGYTQGQYNKIARYITSSKNPLKALSELGNNSSFDIKHLTPEELKNLSDLAYTTETRGWESKLRNQKEEIAGLQNKVKEAYASGDPNKVRLANQALLDYVVQHNIIDPNFANAGELDSKIAKDNLTRANTGAIHHNITKDKLLMEGAKLYQEMFQKYSSQFGQTSPTQFMSWLYGNMNLPDSGLSPAQQEALYYYASTKGQQFGDTSIGGHTLQDIYNNTNGNPNSLNNIDPYKQSKPQQSFGVDGSNLLNQNIGGSTNVNNNEFGYIPTNSSIVLTQNYPFNKENIMRLG